jgi:arabinogalactan oligomer/maltooligosaccharide transport system substrate-binding protein
VRDSAHKKHGLQNDIGKIKGNMKTKIITLSIILILVSFIFHPSSFILLSGCGKKSEPVNLTFWHTFNPQETETLLSILNGFMKQNPDIKVQANQIKFDEGDARVRFKTLSQEGKAPDIMRLDIGWVSEFASSNYLAPIDELITQEDRNDYLEKQLEFNTYQGKLYGVPQVTDCLVLFYNKRLFKESGVNVPETVEDFVKVAQKLTNPKENRYGFFLRTDSYWFQTFLWAFGGGLIEDNGNIVINSKESIESLNYCYDLIHKYKISPTVGIEKEEYTNMRTGFKFGNYAMIVDGPWATTDILSGKEFTDKSNLGITRTPKGKGGYGSPIGGQSYTISANSKYKNEAYKFINFINSKENQITFALNNGLLPTRKSVYQDEKVKSNEMISAFKNVLDVARNRPMVSIGGELYNVLTPAYRTVLRKQAKSDEAFNKVADDWKKLLSSN